LSAVIGRACRWRCAVCANDDWLNIVAVSCGFSTDKVSRGLPVSVT
jgi:hypothetical protein